MLMPPYVRIATSFQRHPVDVLLLFSLLLVLLPGLGLALLDLFPLPVQLDFATYYLAAQALNAGASPYDRVALATLALQQGGIAHAAYFYPPAFAALLRPFALLPFPVTNALWFALNLLWYVLGLLLLARLLALPRAWLGPLLGFGMLVPALHHTLELGQINTLLFLLIVAAFVMLAGSAQTDMHLAGLWLGLAGAIKLFPLALVLPLFAHRRWRSLAALAISLVLFTTLGILFGGGIDETVTWLTAVLPAIAGGFSSPNNQSLLAAFTRLGTPTTVEPFPLFAAPARLTIAPMLNDAALLRTLGLATAASIALVTLAALVRRWRTSAGPVQLDAALLLVVSLLATPIVWYHYYLLLLIPIGVGLKEGWRDTIVRRLIFAGCLLIAIQRYWRLTALLGSPLLLAFGTCGTLLIWLALLFVALRQQCSLTQALT